MLKTTHTTHAAREKYIFEKKKDYSHSYAYDRTYAYTAETETETVGPTTIFRLWILGFSSSSSYYCFCYHVIFSNHFRLPSELLIIFSLFVSLPNAHLLFRYFNRLYLILLQKNNEGNYWKNWSIIIRWTILNYYLFALRWINYLHTPTRTLQNCRPQKTKSERALGVIYQF